MKIIIRPMHLATVALLIVGCATPPPASVNYPASVSVAPVAATPPPALAPPPAAPVPPITPAVDVNANERALVAAIESYDRGEFPSAIRQLTPMVTDASLDPAQLVRALKTLAFSQCSSNAVTACRQTFERVRAWRQAFDGQHATGTPGGGGANRRVFYSAIV